MQLTQITASNCHLTKTFSRNAHGQIESNAIAHMTEGRATIIDVDTLAHLSTIFSLLQPNQAITCGLPSVGDTPLTTRAGAEFRPDAVARTNEAFTFPYGTALFPIDVDVDGDTFSSVGAVLDALEACSPWLEHVSRIARPSSSSYIGGRGLRGVHVYVAVTRGTDIPALAKRMQVEQWAAGRGSIKISKSGALLVRQLSDAMVYQPSRLMFEAEPVLQGDIVRETPHDQAFIERAPRVAVGHPVRYKSADGLLDVQLLPTMRDIEVRRFETNVRAAKHARRSEAKRIAIDYQKANAIAAGLDPVEGERYGLLATRALGDRKLPAAWSIHVKDIGPVKIADILSNLESALGHQCADPFDTWRPDLEVKHCTKAEIVMLGDKPGVWSHKLQAFFEFTNDVAADLSSPLEMAAERFCGLVEYPEPAGKKAATELNIAHGLGVLLREIDCRPRYNVALDRIERDDLPSMLALQSALARIGCANVGVATLERVIGSMAQENRFDPWKDMMLRLPVWDKVPRLDTVFQDVCGAPPAVALEMTGQMLFAAIVMRQLAPGAPAPVVPVLIGPPGVGKSRFVAGIAAALGAPPPSSIAFGDDRRMSMAAKRSIVAELAEMSGIGRREVEDVKRWVTDDMDVYRKPYAPDEEEHPRRFVPVGTANKHELNRDETGNRRFMPVHVLQKIDPNWSVEVPQLLAEAKARFCDDTARYYALVRTVADEVYAYNDADMQRGEGTPHTDLDDLMPDIMRGLLRRSGERRIKSADIRAALDAHASGRQIRSREYAKWLVTRKWEAARSSSTRFYIAPQEFIDEEVTKPILSVVNPFMELVK